MKYGASHWFFSIVLVISLFVSTIVHGAALSGTYTLPGTVNGIAVNNLTQLSALLNGGTNTVNGTVIFEFTSAYNTSNIETLPVTFNAFSGVGNVIIRPAASVSSPLITGGSPGSIALIQLNGVSHITFDGRPGGTGAALEWTFQNTAVSGSYPAVLLINGATYDTLEYLTILSSGTSSTSTVNISTSTVSGGNSYDVISNCNIGPYSGFPYNPILSVGSTGAFANGNNTIANNNIYNFATYTNNSPYYAGINIGPTGNGSNWTITGNSIYSSANYLNFGSTPYHAIYLNAGANSTGNNISGNYIGGSQPLCAGTAWQVPAYQANGYADFDGIAVATGACNVTNNVIENIFMASRYGSSTFRGISIISGTAFVSGNTIGAANDSIISGLYGTMIGIQNQSTAAVTINNNTIANFVSDGRAYNSTYSSTTTGVSIGIYAYSSSAVVGATTITNNTISNFSRIDNYNNNLYFPVDAGDGTGSPPYNVIYEMNTIAGICVESAGSGLQTISKNTVYNLYNNLTGGTFRTYINGIVDIAGSGGSVVNGNLVYGLYAPNTYGASTYFYGLNGIYIPASFAGIHTVTNNMIDLGYRPTDGSSVQNALITGIWDNSTYSGTGLKVKLLHNSVYIGGSNTNAFSNNLNSYAFRRVLDYGGVYDSLDLYNNIFVNNRSNTTGSSVNYGIYLNSTLNVASDYSEIYGTGTGFNFGNVAGTNYATLATYQSANTGFEVHSLSSDPLFLSPATATPNLHVQPGTPIDAQGNPAATLVYDFDSLVRANYSPVDIGAAVACSSASAASVTLTVSQDTVCSGTLVTFTASGTNGGSSPTYNFYKNGVSVQSSSLNSYTISSPANNDSVKVVMTSSAACVSPATATSNSITVSVSSNTLTPSVTISPSQNNFCHGTSVTFTATATNGGSSPIYKFYLNGSSVQNGTSNTYANANLNNGDSVWVVLTSNAACLSTTTATSAKVYMVVSAVVAPSVSLSASQTTICNGTQVTFTATPGNGGSGPTYNFYLNGNSVQTGTGNTYTTGNLNNNDSVWVVLTSNATCVSPATATSNKIHMLVNATVVPAITITTVSNTICSNAMAIFNSTITNGGTNPSYQWKKNGTNVATGASYTAGGLVTGDVITCVLTSNANCVAPDTAVSNTISMTVNNTLTATISINPSIPLITCQGQPVNFIASITNGGNTPAYIWKKNGAIVGGDVSSYLDASPVNGDVVECILTSSSACVSPVTVSSNVDTVVVHPTPTYSYTQQICQGDSLLFGGKELRHTGNYSDTLSTVYSCDSIVFLQLTVSPVQAEVKNASVCAGSNYTYNGRSYSQTGTYHDTLSSVAGCDSFITINLTVSPEVSVYDSVAICSGSSYNFNGHEVTSAGSYHDTLTTSLGCDSAVTLVLTVHAKPVPVVTLSGIDSLATTSFVSYQWLSSNQPISGATDANYVAAQNGTYLVVVVDSNGCDDTSSAVSVTALSLDNVSSDYGVKLFPNPSTGVFALVFNGNPVHVVEIADAVGRVVVPSTKVEKQGSFNITELAAGIYQLIILDDKQAPKVIKVVKQ